MLTILKNYQNTKLDDATRSQLERRIPIFFQEPVSLLELSQYIAKKTKNPMQPEGVPCIFDLKAFLDTNIRPSTRLIIQFNELTLGEALTALSAEHGLCYVIEEGYIIFTTPILVKDNIR